MPAQYALREVRLSDLPALKRWRALPEVRRHLRHPDISWPSHLRWWWGIRRHTHPTRKVWAVTLDGKLAGQAGLYYKMGPAAEVSLLVVTNGREDFAAEREVMGTILMDAAHEWGLNTLWAEVLATAPLARHDLFDTKVRVPPIIWADNYSTIYRWRIV